MKSNHQYHEQIAAQQNDADRRAAMLAYADALRQWGDVEHAEGWIFLARKRKRPNYSPHDKDFSWFEEGPDFPARKPYVLKSFLFQRLTGGVNHSLGWREYPTRLEAEIAAALAYAKGGE